MGGRGSFWGTSWGGSPPDYEAAALARIMEQYKQSTTLKTILTIHADRWEKVAWVAEAVGVGFGLNDSIGAQQDVIGRILDLARGLDTDERYRILLTTRAQHIIPAGRNRIPVILTIIRLLTGDDDRDINWIESYPMGYIIEIDDLTAQEKSDLLDFLPLTRPTCYQAWLVDAALDGFVYDTTTGSVTPEGKGYSSSVDNTLGGPYASVQEI